MAELLRTGESMLLHALALLRGLGPDIVGTGAVVLSAEDAADVLCRCESITQFAEQLGHLTARARPEEIVIRLRDLETPAAAALVAGVADVHRVEVLARCLPVREGFRALAETLRCTESHKSWLNTTIGHVLVCFRGSDLRFVRRLTGHALLSPETLWESCTREQVARLAAVLEQHAATNRCR